MMRRLVWTFFLVCTTSLVNGQTNLESLWVRAQDAYLREAFDTSVALFERVVQLAPASFPAMYNLGNCYLRKGDLGKAILWYERARKLRPLDQDLLHNLSLAKTRRMNPVVEIEEFFVMRWIRNASGLLSIRSWGILSVLVFWILVFLCAIAIRKGSWGASRWIVLMLSFCFLFILIMAIQRLHDLRDHSAAIVQQNEVTVLIAPEPESKLVARIGAGEKVVILDSLNSYVKVRLANFEQGWIAIEGIERI